MDNIFEEFYGSSFESEVVGTEGLLDNKFVRFGIKAGAAYIGFKIAKHFIGKKIKKLQDEDDARYKANIDRATIKFTSEQEVKEWLAKLDEVMRDISFNKVLSKTLYFEELIRKLGENPTIINHPVLKAENRSSLEDRILSATNEPEYVRICIWDDDYSDIEALYVDGDVSIDFGVFIEKDNKGNPSKIIFVNEYNGNKAEYKYSTGLYSKYGLFGEFMNRIVEDKLYENKGDIYDVTMRFLDDAYVEVCNVNKDIQHAFFNRMNISYNIIKIETGYIDIPVKYIGGPVNE